MIRIRSVELTVTDQGRALDFYTRVLGLRVAADVPMGDTRWIALTDADDPDGVQLELLEAGLDEERALQRERYRLGNAALTLGVDDIDAEYARLSSLGAVFRGPVARAPQGKAATVLLDDGCGNWIHLYQM